MDLFHETLPLLVNAVELLPLLAAPLLNLLRRDEDVLQVEPIPLEDLPLLDCVADRDQHLVGLVDITDQSFDVARALDVTDASEGVVEGHYDCIPIFQLVNILGLLVLYHSELLFFPSSVDLVQLTCQLVFLRSRSRDMHHLFLLLTDIKADELSQGELFLFEGKV